MNDITFIFAQFIIYSFIGYICEVFYCSFLQKKVVNRGFLFGPLCPIYGFGAILTIYSLRNLMENPVVIFILGMLITSTLEYYTSYIFEKIFNNKWWDYSYRSDNINGRICLHNSIYFGLGIVIILYVVNPYLESLINLISRNILDIISIIIFILLIIDFVFSSIIAYNLRSRIIIAEELKSTKLKMIPQLFEKKHYEKLSKIKFKQNRLLKNYPNLAKDLRKELNTVKEMVIDTKSVKNKKRKKRKNVKKWQISLFFWKKKGNQGLIDNITYEGRIRDMSKNIRVRQQDIKDCGAACLLSIIRYYNGNISLEKIKIDSCISSKGISAYNLIAAAKKYGFDSKGVKITYQELIKSHNVPFIAYMKFNNGLKHYIVVYKITKKYLLVMDPASTLKKVKHDYFQENFKDVIIELYPINNIVSYNQDNKLLDMFFKIFNCNKKIIISIIISSIILTITSIISSFYFKSIISSIENNLTSIFICISTIFLIINLIKVFISYLRIYYETYLNKNIDVVLFEQFIRHIFNLPLNAIANKTSGEISTRINELNNIKELFSNMFITLMLNLLMAITSLIVLFYINDKLTFILLLIIIIYLINNIIWLKPINNYVEDNITLETNFNSTLINNLNHIISIKNNFSYPINKLEEKLLSYLSHTFNFKNKINIYILLNSFIIDIGLFILNVVGFIFILNNSLLLIDLITYDTLYIYLIDPIKDIINLIPKYIFIKRSFIKINDFLMLEEENIKDNNNKFINGDIYFDNIKFSYNKYDYPINNYSLRIKKGSKVLVMGKSGLGKSTLFKLLFRLYNLDNGSIKINDVDIRNYSLSTLRNNITYVSQDEAIINDTLENNILMGKNINLKTLNKVLNITQVNEILDKKALKLKSYILEDASNLSGGERARIILARTLIKNSPIIIFDETFSSIAQDGANLIISNILNNYKDKTIIIISHFKPRYKFDIVINEGFNNG